MRRFHLELLLPIVLAVPCAGQMSEFERTLENVEELGRRHRFQEIVELLHPLEGKTENRETQYIIAAELGRAYFHLGEYDKADQHLRSAVTLHPERVESALYLQATSYLLGDRTQSFAILDEVLRSGARDLYLAVTLPGERAFLGDPEVWRLLDRHAIPIDVDLSSGIVDGVRLGMDRKDVGAGLGVEETLEVRPVLSASAGPHTIWSYRFSDAGLLEEVFLYNENLAKYTPFRLHIGKLDWRTTPAEVTSLLGAPAITTTDEHSNVTMRWPLKALTATMVFGHPRPPRPPDVPDGVAMLRVLRLTRRADP